MIRCQDFLQPRAGVGAICDVLLVLSRLGDVRGELLMGGPIRGLTVFTVHAKPRKNPRLGIYSSNISFTTVRVNNS